MTVHNIDVNLTVQQDEYTSRNCEDRQDHTQTSESRNKFCQACENEPDAQQQKADIFCEFHGDIYLFSL